jgi:hypothetical protein
MSTYPHNHDNDFRIYEKDGILWVTHEELLRCGYRNIGTFTIVYKKGTFYEIQGHSYKGGGWWIEEINPETEEIEPEAYSTPSEE